MCAHARAISGFLEFSRAPSSVECVQTEPQALTNLMTNDVQVFAIDPAAVTAVNSALQRLGKAARDSVCLRRMVRLNVICLWGRGAPLKPDTRETDVI